MDKSKKQNGDILRRVLVVVLFFVFVASAVLMIHFWDKKQGQFTDGGDSGDLQDRLEFEGKEYVLNQNVETVLVTGLDTFDSAQSGENYYNDQQADFLMLFVLDNENKTFSAIHINRDTMANINVLGVAGQKIGEVTEQIALAHTYGNGQLVSLRNTADAVSDLLLGVKIDHYVSVKLDAVQIVNDAVGGVTVEVIGDFTGIDDTLVEGQEVTLLGQQAMNYIRTRQGMKDDTNIARMERQRQYLSALHRQFEAAMEKDEGFAAETVLSVADYLVSNMNVEQMQALLEKVAEYELQEIHVPQGESKVGEEFMEFYPDADTLKKLLIELFYVNS